FRDPFVIIAIGDRAADDQQQHLRQRMRHTPRLARVLDDSKMIEQRPQARLGIKIKTGEAHGGCSESGEHNRIRLSASRKPPLTRVRCPAKTTNWIDFRRISM